jgi:hypothetical protein
MFYFCYIYRFIVIVTVIFIKIFLIKIVMEFTFNDADRKSRHVKCTKVYKDTHSTKEALSATI